MDYTYPASYEASRSRFIQDVNLIRPIWPQTTLLTHPLAADPSASIDYAWGHARQKKNLVILSTALHGVEGFAGSVMLKLFMEEFAPKLDPETTGLLLIHAINPIGMKHHRRCNENNVDLNRNFFMEEKYPADLNPDYEELFHLLNPQNPLRSLLLSDIAFMTRVLISIMQLGVLRIRHGLLSGQYRHPRGVFYGGNKTEEGVFLIKSLLDQALSEYENIIHVDMHTGYGPRHQMSLVNSTREQAPAGELKRRFDYPLIVSTTPSEFYTVTGDLTDYFYQLREKKHPKKNLFATCFEFGTFGESLPAQIRSMRAAILENRIFQHGTTNTRLRKIVSREYDELFMPSERAWLDKAVTDCRRAMTGILNAHDLMR